MHPVVLTLRPWSTLSLLALAAISLAIWSSAPLIEIVVLAILWVTTLITAVREHRRTEALCHEAEAHQLALRKRNEELLRANAALERFTSVAAHQMRSPPRTIRGLATTLREDYCTDVPEEAIKIVDSIIRKADALAEIVTVLHEIGSRHAMSITVHPVQLLDVLPRTRERVNEQFYGHVELDVPSDLYVLGNDTLLLELFANLLENGWKFNKSPMPTVKFVARRILDRVRVRVSDNGIGLDPSTNGLFELFRRHTDQFPGTGVGLALVKQAVEKQGGFIAVHPPHLGEGAVFVVDLPCAEVPK